MSWLVLSLAGLLEVAWAVGLKHTHGFTRPVASVLTIAATIASFYLLSVALRSLPLGTAYAVWVGIGAVGTALAGILLFGESLSATKFLSLALLLAGILGLKLS